MMGSDSPSDYRYWAFISYSHADTKFAQQLHRALETYRVPKPLVGRVTRGEPIPPRLFPIFLDRAELSGASDLGGTLREQLERSRFLLVVCSPDAARSTWVDREIEYFKSLGRPERILCIISSASAAADDEWMPAALRAAQNPMPSLESGSPVPMAADARTHGDGWDNARLKVVAGILGVAFDELRQRERQRRTVQRRRQAVLTASLMLLGVGLYTFLADAGAPLPASSSIRRQLDRHNLTWSRAVPEASQVHASAIRLRSQVTEELVRRMRSRDWELPVFGAASTSKLLDVWLAAQSATGVLREGATAARGESWRELTAVFDAAFAPGLMVESGGRLYGWRAGHYRPTGNQQIIGSGTAVGAPLWMAAGLAVTLSNAGLGMGSKRTEYADRAAVAHSSAEAYSTADGGWNFFPDQLEPSEHSTYAAVLALLTLLETRTAALPWNGSVEARDLKLRTTVEWLVNQFDSRTEPAGWRGAPGEAGQAIDGLTLQAYAELLRAEAEFGVRLPDEMIRAIGVCVEGLAQRSVDYPMTSRTYLRPYRKPDGTLAEGQESVFFAWHPWAIETSARWIRRLERAGAPREDVLAARRSLAHLVVDLGPDMVSRMIGGIGFPIAETAYALATVEPM